MRPLAARRERGARREKKVGRPSSSLSSLDLRAELAFGFRLCYDPHFSREVGRAGRRLRPQAPVRDFAARHVRGARLARRAVRPRKISKFLLGEPSSTRLLENSPPTHHPARKQSQKLSVPLRRSKAAARSTSRAAWSPLGRRLGCSLELRVKVFLGFICFYDNCRPEHSRSRGHPTAACAGSRDPSLNRCLSAPQNAPGRRICANTQTAFPVSIRKVSFS